MDEGCLEDWNTVIAFKLPHYMPTHVYAPPLLFIFSQVTFL